MSLVTVERGAIRVIMVSRPVGQTSARGLMMTLSNPSGMQFTPVSAPIALMPIADGATQLGFIKLGSADTLPTAKSSKPSCRTMASSPSHRAIPLAGKRAPPN